MATRSYQQHGLNALKRRLKVRGLDGIDKRSAAARALLAWRQELETDLGGPETISAQQRAIIDVASTTKLLLDSVDRWLLEQKSLINAKRRTLYAVVGQRQQLADALARYMALLGLERRSRPAQSLEQYVAAKYGRNGTERRDEISLNAQTQPDPPHQDQPQDPRTDDPGAAVAEPHV